MRDPTEQIAFDKQVLAVYLTGLEGELESKLRDLRRLRLTLGDLREGLVSMSPPASRDDPDADPRTLQRPARSEVPQDCERETRERVDDASVDDAEPDGYGFGV